MGPCFAYIIYNSTDEYSQEEHIEIVRNIPFGRRKCFVQKQESRKRFRINRLTGEILPKILPENGIVYS